MLLWFVIIYWVVSVGIGIYAAPNRTVSVVGLRDAFQFETRADGALEAHPVSPDMVCARLKLRRG